MADNYTPDRRDNAEGFDEAARRRIDAGTERRRAAIERARSRQEGASGNDRGSAGTERRRPAGTQQRPAGAQLRPAGAQQRPEGARPRTSVQNGQAQNPAAKRPAAKKPASNASASSANDTRRRSNDTMRVERREPVTYEYDNLRPGSKPPKKRKTGLIIAIVIILIVLIGGGALAAKKLAPSKARMDLNEYFGMGEGEVAVFINDQRVEPANCNTAAHERNGDVYVSLNFLTVNTACRFYYNSDGTLRYMYPEEIVSVREGDTTFTGGGTNVSMDHELFYVEDGIAYVSADLINQVDNITIDVYGGDSEPARIFITDDFDHISMITASSDTEIRYRGGPKSDILLDLPAGTAVRFLDDLDDWLQVSYGGVVGYVKTSDMNTAAVPFTEAPDNLPAFTGAGMNESVLMLWHPIYSYAANGDMENLISSAPGANVICPTWYSVSDGDGSITNLSSADYVAAAHSRGLKVWAVIDDINSRIDYDSLVRALGNAESRRHIINSVISDALEVGVDGLNLDFENVSNAGCEGSFEAFLRELSVECRKHGLTLSVDNFILAGGRTHDLREQDLIADYVVMMCYDEYWGVGSGAGPTSSYQWFSLGVNSTVDYGVDPSKIVAGMSMYTRAWSLTPSELADPSDSLDENGNAVGTSTSNMPNAVDRLNEHNATITWDDDLKLWYGTYEENGITYMIWYEDADSIAAKMTAVSDADIAGVAIWSLSWWNQWNDSSVWSAIRTPLGR